MRACEICSEPAMPEMSLDLEDPDTGEAQPLGVFCPICARQFVAVVVARSIGNGEDALALAVLTLFVDIENERKKTLN